MVWRWRKQVQRISMISVKRKIATNMVFWCNYWKHKYAWSQLTWWDMRVWTAHDFVVSKPIWINRSQDPKSWHGISTMENIVDNSFEVIPATRHINYIHNNLNIFSYIQHNEQSTQSVSDCKKENLTTQYNAINSPCDKPWYEF